MPDAAIYILCIIAFKRHISYILIKHGSLIYFHRTVEYLNKIVVCFRVNEKRFNNIVDQYIAAQIDIYSYFCWHILRIINYIDHGTNIVVKPYELIQIIVHFCQPVINLTHIKRNHIPVWFSHLILRHSYSVDAAID